MDAERGESTEEKDVMGAGRGESEIYAGVRLTKRYGNGLRQGKV